MKIENIVIALVAVAYACASCADESINNSSDSDERAVTLHAEIDQLNPTRADDSGFADGDRIGIYAVDYRNGQPGTLQNSGNNSDNLAYVFDEDSYRWNGSKAIFFADDETAMDVIGYYPYSEDMDEVCSHQIAVESNQRSENLKNGMSPYEASDFLWAKVSGVTPSAPEVILTFRHTLSSVRVTIVEGDGFEKNEWNDLPKSVIVGSTSRYGKVDLSTGIASASTEKDNRGILARQDRTDHRAIVIPQKVKGGEVLLTITVGSQTYDYIRNQDMVYNPSRQHNFTISVNKKTPTGDYEFSLVEESITAWESDVMSHNGAAKEYIVVELEKGESLSSKIKSLGIDPEETVNLKVTGKMHNEDFEYIRKAMSVLEAINLHEADLSECTDYLGNNYCLPEFAFIQMQSLKTCVFPAKIKIIGNYAFMGTCLTGSLEIPEGVEEIGSMAFMNTNETNTGLSVLPGSQILSKNNLTGTLTLPSTLKTIGSDAFRECDFTGNLILPDGLEFIGGRAFAGCRRFSGDIHVPESVMKIEEGAFSGMTGISGRFTLPKKLHEIPESLFEGSKITMIEWPLNLKSIGSGAFSSIDFKGVVTLPDNVIDIGGHCFYGSGIRNINLPPDLTIIPASCFAKCVNLSDTLSLPSKVELIQTHAFEGCSRMEAVILPASLKRIYPYAFLDCPNLNYIRCNAKEPPVLDEGAFWGVQKDNFTVEVPEQSVEAYRNAQGWREFKRISAYRNFVARPSKCKVLNKGGKKEIVLNADSDWEMTECPSWCHVDKESGSKKTQLTLTVEQMAKGSPARQGKVTFRLKGTDGYLTHINVSQYDYQYDENQSISLQSSSKGKGIDLVFLGDGYDAADISEGTYLKDMKQEMEYLFAIEPYKSYREYFNVYTAFAISGDSGVDAINAWRNTKFHVNLGDGVSRVTADYIKALDYCAEYVPQTVNGPAPMVGCVLVANSDMYEGITYSVGDSFCSVVTKSSESYPNDASGIVQHEVGGHGIGWLGDEYVYHYDNIRRCGCECCGHVWELEKDHAIGWSLNLSLVGMHKDVPWSHLVFNPDYGDIVDVYEGGYFHSRGVYRSELNSCMNNNVAYYSTWCRQLIVERIMKLAGEKFNLADFYANDSRDVGNRFNGTTRGNADSMNVRHAQPPVRITGYEYGKKGGRK